ncbi:hypothetical protein ANN_10026 [Periplaneta americana]|uniref:HTH psq-type domain-containing protein n=1 Tax=Periplaneta americana TaxID=6978 RepID=A0ABQ8TMX7_PERAM|nr:hypothetical protein ANN_10026 [Periplaneta americana]
MPKVQREYRKHYRSQEVTEAVTKVLREGWSTYKASKVYKIPYNTVKDRLKFDSGDGSLRDLAKLGRPFPLTSEEEVQLVNYIRQMQEIGFGLSASDVRHYAFKLIESKERKNAPFNSDNKEAGWKWWSFKERYGLVMSLPENLSVARAAAN